MYKLRRIWLSLYEGVSPNKLSKKYYNIGVPSFIVGALILYSAFLSVSQFNIDASGLYNLFLGLSLGAFVSLLLYGSVIDRSIKFADKLKVMVGGVLILVVGLFAGENSTVDIISNGLINIDYVVDHQYILTIESLSLIALALFFFQSTKIIKEKTHSDKIQKELKMMLYIVFGGLLAKSFYGILGGQYESYSLVILLLVFSFLIQKSFLYYVNNPDINLEIEKTKKDGIGFDIVYFIALPILFFSLDFSWYNWLLIPVFYSFIVFFNPYKTIYFNLFAVVLLFLVGISFIGGSFGVIAGMWDVFAESWWGYSSWFFFWLLIFPAFPINIYTSAKIYSIMIFLGLFKLFLNGVVLA